MGLPSGPFTTPSTTGMVVGRGVGEVGDLALAQDLHAIRMDVVQVADEVGARARGAHGHFVEAALGSAEAGNPFPLEVRAMVFEKNVGADDGGLHGLRITPAAPTARWRSGGAVPPRRCSP